MLFNFLLIFAVLLLSNDKIKADEYCGLRNGTSGFSYGGTEVRRGDWPWTVALVYKPMNTFFCSASLISKKHSLTG
jgi:secreted trypsin-like serine protease